MLTNFELKKLKPKLDIVKKPENRVHELTDSNVSPTRIIIFSRERSVENHRNSKVELRC